MIFFINPVPGKAGGTLGETPLSNLSSAKIGLRWNNIGTFEKKVSSIPSF